MDTTLLPDGIIPLLKHTARAAVAAAVVPGSTGPQRVEQLTGYSAGQISRWQGDAHADLMPLEVVALLEFTTQKPVFARALAALTGHRLVPITEAEGPEADAGMHIRDMADFTAAAAAVSGTYGAALADGVVTPRERAEIRKAKARLQDVVARAGRNLSGVKEG
ncbi:hypothetical protein J5J86_14065 [Aquabacter sp. L1I39]|uniref:hypothetical protein n=1 Tax=Aquabacter sp. L1I39 TaxID=2820278 RepID=UPI001ADB3389|nr:hypothetical protein [Aquabacter sp. L1I39]QTL01931.1 hypothetical protein J5J86_14065 [Aquabacter sp. L1I39]